MKKLVSEVTLIDDSVEANPSVVQSSLSLAGPVQHIQTLLPDTLHSVMTRGF